MNGESFREILGSLSLSSTGRALRIATVVRVQGTSERHVALIGQWSDDETRSVTQILITIAETGVGLLAESVKACVIALERITIKVSELFPVVAKLGGPQEVVQVVDLSLDHLLNYKLGMHIKYEEGT